MLNMTMNKANITGRTGVMWGSLYACKAIRLGADSQQTINERTTSVMTNK